MQWRRVEQTVNSNSKKLIQPCSRGVFEISPNFRLVALGDAESVNATGPTAKWLNDQLLSLFIFHTLPSMESAQELQLISKLVPNFDQKTAEKLIGFVQKLSDSHDAKVKF